jgi:hypothetical protein
MLHIVAVWIPIGSTTSTLGVILLVAVGLDAWSRRAD